MKHHILAFSLLFGILSCGNTSSKQTTQQETPTPDTFTDVVEMGMGSVSKRYKKDIIERLYQEALDKNSELEKMHETLSALQEDKGEFMEVLDEYTRTNADYFSTSDRYISQISDSTLREATSKVYNRIKEDYKQKISKHDISRIQLKNNVVRLQDELILIKLSVTQSMMDAYRTNELPDINQLKDLNKRYDDLIQETKTFLEDESI